MATSAPKAKPVTLTQTASVMRKVNIGILITLAVVVVGRFFVDSLVQYWIATHPEPPPEPRKGFGILPRIQFPNSVDTTLTYKLELPQRKLQPPSDRANVYFMPTERANLLALDRAKKQAATLGFLLDPEPLTNEIYRWRHTTPLQSLLDYNIVNGTFTQRLDWQSDPTFLQSKQLPSEDDAISRVRGLLSGAGLLEKDIATGSAKITYLKASATGYAPTVSLSESDFIQVDIFRTPVDGTYDIVTDKPNHGTVRAILTGKSDANLMLALMEYTYFRIDYEHPEDYPIIFPGVAFELLKSGKGYVAQAPEGQTEAVIRNIRLGYYDSPKQQAYLQPIYILEGDGGFVGYVPAIPDSLIQSE